MSKSMNGGEALVATLVSHGIDTTFGIPGESYLAVLDALRNSQEKIRYVITRHEAGASFAACAYGRLSRKPGVAFVTRGPGATNASIGVHTARQDSVPMLLFVGQVPTEQRGREAFQEVDYHQMFGPLAKAVFEPEAPQEVASVTAEAFGIALDGRPGPVVIALPEDVTEGDAGTVAVPQPHARKPHLPNPDDLRALAERLAAAKHPLVIAGEQVSFEGTNDTLATFSEASACGVINAFRRQGVIPASHRSYLGPIGLAIAPYQKALMADVDLVLALGTRLDLATTVDDTLVSENQFLAQVFPDADVLKAVGAGLRIDADTAPVLDALVAAASDAPPSDERRAWLAMQREAFEAFQGGDESDPIGSVDMAAVIHTLAELLPSDSTITNDAGNFSTWLHRHYPHEHWLTQAAPAAGSMGYAVPGAVGAQFARPGKRVVAVVGDGGFSMTGQELITAVTNRLPIIVLLCDNAGYGTIAMHQYRRYGVDATYGIGLDNPDFAGAARAWGASAWTVDATDGFRPALEQALVANGPSLIHIKTDMRDLAASGLKMT
jgi:acetolactate synthase-1/2/3 large subunit